MSSPPVAGGTAAETSRRGGGEDEGAGASGGAPVVDGRKGAEFRSLVYRRGLAAEPPEEKARYHTSRDLTTKLLRCCDGIHPMVYCISRLFETRKIFRLES